MSIVYLNGAFVAQEEAKISVLDRGFLFGDGVYEVIPVTASNKLLCCDEHIDRLSKSLIAIDMSVHISNAKWREIFKTLLDKNTAPLKSFYIQITRGSDVRRHHYFPKNLSPTVLILPIFDDEKSIEYEKNMQEARKGVKLITERDMRWKRCHIKSTSLLGNIMHYRSARLAGAYEAALVDDDGLVCECSSSNLFVVKAGVIMTPPENNRILPGVTRNLIMKLVTWQPELPLQIHAIHAKDLLYADEIWITSSNRDIVPVTMVDENIVGDGKPGKLWKTLDTRLHAYKQQY